MGVAYMLNATEYSKMFSFHPKPRRGGERSN